MTKRRRNLLLIASLKGCVCMDCGGTFRSSQLDFDHVRGIKLFNVSDMLHCSEEEIRAEIAKCEVVCASCHRLRTEDRLLDAHVLMAELADDEATMNEE